MQDQVFRLLSIAVLVLLATATLVYHWLEDWSWVDSLYFSVVAITTVGFGDLSPSRDASKLFTVVYLLAGLAIVTTYLNERMRRLPGRARWRSRPNSGDDVDEETEGGIVD